jgi:hypothetical protein
MAVRAGCPARSLGPPGRWVSQPLPSCWSWSLAWPWLAAARAAAARAAATCRLPGHRSGRQRLIADAPAAGWTASRQPTNGRQQGWWPVQLRMARGQHRTGCLGDARIRAAMVERLVHHASPQPPSRLQLPTDRGEGRCKPRVRTDCPAAAVDTPRWPAAAAAHAAEGHDGGRRAARQLSAAQQRIPGRGREAPCRRRMRTGEFFRSTPNRFTDHPATPGTGSASLEQRDVGQLTDRTELWARRCAH